MAEGEPAGGQMEERFTLRLDYVVGGTPSRFMMYEGDFERLYKFMAYVAALDPAERPPEEAVRSFVEAALPRREQWASEIMTAYRHGLAFLDHVRDTE